MTERRIRLSVDGGIARIVLANAQGRNAVDAQFCSEFAAAARACEADPAIAAILLAAEGEVFSVGGDLRDFLANRSRIRAHVHSLATAFHAGILALRRASAPVVAAVAGVAAGGGFSLVCGADLVIAARSAKLVSAYTRTGLTPDGGGTFFLPRIVGERVAFDLMATNPTLSAEQAKTLGIVSRVVDDDVFDAEVETLVTSLAAAPSGALAGLKRLLNASAEAELVARLNAEAESIADRAAHPDTLRRLDAFLAKR